MKDIWIPLSGAVAQQNQIDMIANNVANINTPGFKKDQMAFKEYLTIFAKAQDQVQLPNKEWKPGDFYHSDGAEFGFVKSDGAYTIFKQGQLVPTGNPLDLGIFGEGFFEVLTPNGIRFT
ncbi:MAG: flagellar hook basal-body protein, partial [Oligoflexia bacterium]|nr:flagellar hook basal-body protein [Oligoflexia bacterium]